MDQKFKPNLDLSRIIIGNEIFETKGKIKRAELEIKSAEEVIEKSKLYLQNLEFGLNKLVDLYELPEMPDNDDFLISKALTGNRDIFEIIKRNAKI